MHLLALLIIAAQPAAATMSELMAKTIYPASDAVFYITTRTPAGDADWKQLESQTTALATAAAAMTSPRYFRDRDRWMIDAQLLIDASNAAVTAVQRRDVAALEALNDAMYTSCVQCHQHYRPNYGRRPADATGPGPAAPNVEGVWTFSTLTPLAFQTTIPLRPSAPPLAGRPKSCAPLRVLQRDEPALVPSTTTPFRLSPRRWIPGVRMSTPLGGRSPLGR